ncbi:MAG TPA: amidohydrolase [Longimicrobiales bacterium]|nr:amidohydrolase [Longimicrobiales bacterium]
MSQRPALLLLIPTLLTGCAAADNTADLLLTGGVVWTGDAAAPAAEAVAIRDGRIIAVGTAADLRAYDGAATRTIDLRGRFVAPGFIDDHTHFISGGFQLGSVDLRSSATPEEFTARIGAFARTLPADRWITGGDWDHEMWPGAPLPRREWFDSVSAQHYVAVSRLDGHMMVVNTRVLELAGITRDTPDPAGGTIVRDETTGEPTGVLKDEAMSLVYRVMPASSPSERDEAFRRAQAHALSRGVTMVQDMGDWADLEAYRRAQAAGELRMRIYSFVPLATWERLRDFVAANGRGDDLLQWGGLKGFVDGSLGSTTAWFYEPYEDEPGTSGLMVTDTAQLRTWIINADAAGLHVVVHAIGERANDWLLDVYDAAAEANGARDRRFRIEHAQHLSAAAIPRLAQMGVLPSMQPYHAIDDGRWAEKRIGADRIQRTYAFRSLLDSGANLTFGSDWTVAPIDPLLGIYAATTRRTIDGANPDGWVPQQKITVAEALHAYTAANAFGAFMEDRLGTIRVGALADLVVLSEDLTRIDPVTIGDVQVDYTIVGGDVVHTREGAAVRARRDPSYAGR